MQSPHWTSLRGSLLVLLAFALLPAVLPSAHAQSDSDGNSWTFVSMPDFLNTDVADVRSAPNWEPVENNQWKGSNLTWTGPANATHEEFEASIDYILDQVASENPEFVLAAGDIVNGEWNRYQQGKGREIFGPVDTYRQQKIAMRRAADIFYAKWKERFSSRGLTPYPTVGDHELGDNSWPAGTTKARLIPYWRELFSIYFTRNEDGSFKFDNRPVGTPQEKTAYAIQKNNVLVVSVDLHHQPDPEKKSSDRDSVIVKLGEGQLNWFNNTLRKANQDDSIDFIIVQGHYPVTEDVRMSSASSHMTVKGGTDSNFWKAMEKYNADLYFCGEIHETTTSEHGGVIQVVHGSWISVVPEYTYLRGAVRGKKLNLQLKRMKFNTLGKEGANTYRIWQNEYPHMIPMVDKEYGVQTVGKMTIDKSSGDTEITKQNGEMNFYTGDKKIISPNRNVITPNSK